MPGRGPICGILFSVKLRKNELVVGMCAAMETSRIQWYNLRCRKYVLNSNKIESTRALFHK